MKEISEAVKRDVIDLFRCGVVLPEESESTFISWHGRLEAVEFLQRLYDLQNLPSHDPRFKNAEKDISCHVFFQDLTENWIFSDDRFHIIDGNNNEFLDFICAVFNPAVTKNSIEDKAYPEFYYFKEIKQLLLSEGYELYEAARKGNKPLIQWRESGVLDDQVDNMKQSFSSEYMQKQIEQMVYAINNNPTDAIGKSKELVESCCKTILEQNGTITINPKWDVQKLGRETFRIMQALREISV